MKFPTLILVYVVLLLSACQSAPLAPTSTPAELTEEPPAGIEEAEEPYPYPYPPQPLVTPPSGDEGYPAPQFQADQELSGESVYPPPGSEQSETITWEEAQDLILAGEVAQVTQLHNLTVFLTLKDGRMMQTIEPNIDDVFDLIDQCGDPCSDLSIATE